VMQSKGHASILLVAMRSKGHLGILLVLR